MMIISFVKMKKNIIVLVLMALLVSSIAYSIEVTKDDVLLALRRASFIYLENPDKSNLTDAELSDLYYFYNSTKGNDSITLIDLSLVPDGTLSGVPIESIYLRAMAGYFGDEFLGFDCHTDEVCKISVWDPVLFACVISDTHGADCDDGNACTENTQCFGGSCVDGDDINCNDNNECTDDSCDRGSGCVFTNEADGTLCTSTDVLLLYTQCVSGQCVNVLPDTHPCNSHDVCLSDYVAANASCAYRYTTVACNDSNASTVSDTCSLGDCIGITKSCDDNNNCTDDELDSATGDCGYVFNTDFCDDGDDSTENDVCSLGNCTGTPIPPYIGHNHTACYGSAVYWFDSDGVRSDKIDECYGYVELPCGDPYCKDGDVYHSCGVGNRGCIAANATDNARCNNTYDYPEELLESCSEGCYNGICTPVNCSTCGIGLFDVCDEEECHSLGDCYYSSDSLFSEDCVDVSVVVDANLTCYDINHYECENNVSGLICGYDGVSCQNGCFDSGTEVMHGKCLGSWTLNPRKCVNGTLSNDCIFCACDENYECYGGRCVVPGRRPSPSNYNFPMNENALCVYNNNSNLSREICEYYNSTRYNYSVRQVELGNYPYAQDIKLLGLDVPFDRFLDYGSGLDDWDYEEMSLENFNESVKQPVLEYVKNYPNITHIAVAKGLPTTVKGSSSESGAIVLARNDLYYEIHTDVRHSNQIDNLFYGIVDDFNPEKYPNLKFVVSYLLAYNLEDIKKMIDKSIFTIKDYSNLAWVLDADEDGFSVSSQTINATKTNLILSGIDEGNIIFDISNDKIDFNGVIVAYLGPGHYHHGYGSDWMNREDLFGFNVSNKSIMTTIESFNAIAFVESVRETYLGQIAELFREEVFGSENYSLSFSGAMGNVAEPNDRYSQPYFSFGAYANGMTFAESVFSGYRKVINAQSIPVGDPLMKLFYGKGIGMQCSEDSECIAGNCDLDKEGVKRCHVNSTSCVNSGTNNSEGYDYTIYGIEAEDGERYCFNSTHFRSCLDSEWQLPESCGEGYNC